MDDRTISISRLVRKLDEHLSRMIVEAAKADISYESYLINAGRIRQNRAMRNSLLALMEGRGSEQDRVDAGVVAGEEEDDDDEPVQARRHRPRRWG